MLQRNDRIEDAGELLWELTLVLLLAWILTYICVVRGIKSSGKVSKKLDLFSSVVALYVIERYVKRKMHTLVQ